jgi:DNA replication licensing factor MCM6
MSSRVGPASSPRPQAPPSESAGALSDADGDAFQEEPVQARREAQRTIPKVQDRIGARVQQVFEEFLEKYSIDI